MEQGLTSSSYRLLLECEISLEYRATSKNRDYHR